MTAPPSSGELDEKTPRCAATSEVAIDDQDFPREGRSAARSGVGAVRERKAKEEGRAASPRSPRSGIRDRRGPAMSTAIPVVRLTQTETAKLLKMEELT